MLKAFKTEINPTAEQKDIIARTIGTCRYVYNLYLSIARGNYKAGAAFMNHYEFSKWLNHIWLPSHPEKAWIKDVSSKAVKQSIGNAYTAYKRFFKGMSDYPRYKKKGSQTPRCIS